MLVVCFAKVVEGGERVGMDLPFGLSFFFFFGLSASHS